MGGNSKSRKASIPPNIDLNEFGYTGCDHDAHIYEWKNYKKWKHELDLQMMHAQFVIDNPPVQHWHLGNYIAWFIRKVTG